MKKMEFDLTNKDGILNIENQLKQFKRKNVYHQNAQLGTVTSGATATIDINIEGILKSLIDGTTSLLNRILDLFDGAKKLERQMELAKETIKVSRELGAKSIDITIDTKNKASLKGYVKEIDANLEAKIQNGNKITYNIKFD